MLQEKVVNLEKINNGQTKTIKFFEEKVEKLERIIDDLVSNLQIMKMKFKTHEGKLFVFF